MANSDSSPRPAGSPPKDHVYGKPPGTGDWRRITRLVLISVLAIFTVLFFAFNLETVEVSLVVATVNVPLVLVLIGTFLLGMGFMYLFMYRRQRSARKARARK